VADFYVPRCLAVAGLPLPSTDGAVAKRQAATGSR
jgi:hypothetical protein